MGTQLGLFKIKFPVKAISFETPSQNQNYWQFKLFSCLWALSVLFHMANRGIYDTKLIYALLSLASIFVVFKPGNFFGFVTLLSLQIYDLVYAMPEVPNHLLFAGIVSLTILQALFYLIFKNKSFQINQDEWFKTFAPIIRIEVIILYFYAVFQKLNSGFFLPEVSCASDLLYAQPLPSFISLTPNLVSFNAYFTLIIEGGIPVLLFFKRTRHWGILLGLIFHTILSYSTFNGFYDFSSMVFAAYLVFASPQLSSFIAGQWAKLKKITSATTIHSEFNYMKLFLLVGGFLGGLALIHVLNKKLFDFHAFHLYFFWTGYSLIYIGLFLTFMFREAINYKEADKPFRLMHWSFVIFPVVVFINGMSPYLGLKTEHSYSMFSNLRTEGGISNHYIMPASLQIFDYQKDLVEIISSSDAKLQELADTNNLMVFFSFKDHVARMRPERVEYIRNGVHQTFELSKASGNDDLLIKNNIILRKLFWFRPVSKLSPQPCNH